MMVLTKRRPLKKAHSIATMKEFADNTSMHGLKFIYKEDASLLERVLWVLLFTVGFSFSVFFSWKLWNNWTNSPVLVTIQTTNFPLISYHFPTVTICSVNKISSRALQTWMTTPEARGFRLDEIRRILEIISTNRVKEDEDIDYLNYLLNNANITGYEGYEKLMSSISPTCADIVIYCAWESKEGDCSEFFELEATDDGYCCSFNSIVLKRNAKSKNKTLKYSRSLGVDAGLTVILDTELDDYNVTSSDFVGFKVSIQDPDDFARTVNNTRHCKGKVGFLASPGHQIDTLITGYSQIVNDIQNIDVDKRKCVADNEINLKYFKVYTGPYCILDCTIQLALKECGCIPFYFPVSADLPVCSLASYKCLARINENVMHNANFCTCPDLCTNVWYRNEISSGKYPNPVNEYPPTVINRSDYQHLNSEDFIRYAKDNFIKLNVYFKTTTGLSYIMDQRTTWADFISATGGLLGLGFGFSILSAAELFYFFLFRWFYYWCLSKKESKFIHALQPNISFIERHPDLLSHPYQYQRRHTNFPINRHLRDPFLYNRWIENNHQSGGLTYRQSNFIRYVDDK